MSKILISLIAASAALLLACHAHAETAIVKPGCHQQTFQPTAFENRDQSQSPDGDVCFMTPAFSSAFKWNSPAQAGGIVNTTTAVTIAPSVAGRKNCIADIEVSHDLLGAVTELAIRDGAAGPVLYRAKLQTPATETVNVDIMSPICSATAGNLLEVVTLTAVTGGVYPNVDGFTTQ